MTQRFAEKIEALKAKAKEMVLSGEGEPKDKKAPTGAIYEQKRSNAPPVFWKRAGEGWEKLPNGVRH